MRNCSSDKALRALNEDLQWVAETVDAGETEANEIAKNRSEELRDAKALKQSSSALQIELETATETLAQRTITVQDLEAKLQKAEDAVVVSESKFKTELEQRDKVSQESTHALAQKHSDDKTALELKIHELQRAQRTRTPQRRERCRRHHGSFKKV